MSKYNLRKRHREVDDSQEEESRDTKKQRLESLFSQESDEKSVVEDSRDVSASIDLSDNEEELNFEYNPIEELGRDSMVYIKDAKDLVSKIKEDEPTIFKILQTPMSEEDRKELFLMYEIYKSAPERTMENYELRKRLVNTLTHLSKIDHAEHIRVTEEFSKIPKVSIANNIFEMKKKIVELNTTEKNKSALLEILREFIDSHDSNTNSIQLREKLNFALSLPYLKRSPSLLSNYHNLNELCVHVREVLDQELYGMDQVKDSLISVIVNKYNNPSSRMCVALKGEAGVGKTEICSAFAKALQKPFELIALGSISDATALTGSMNWYVGSNPGLILHALRRFGVCDGVILYDEIDKITEKDKSVENALKDITDYTKNNHFRDTYLPELDHDISQLWTFFTLNSEEKIDPILRNRLVVINVPSYNFEELVIITTKYLLPKALINLGLKKNSISLEREGCSYIINNSRDKSIRQIDASLRGIISKISTINALKLQDGTLGKMKLGYKCDLINKEHTIINERVAKDLMKRERSDENLSFMYT